MIALAFVLLFFFPLSILGSQVNKFGIVIDAGSTGSRIHIYYWPETSKTNSTPEIQFMETKKIKPGISDFRNTPEAAGPNFLELLEYAKGKIPEDLHSTTPIFLLATAGMRAVPVHQQVPILDSIRTTFRQSPFRFQPEWIRVMDGLSEAVFNWLSINYLYGKFENHPPANHRHNDKTMINTFGGLDLGGRSTQIAFEVSESEFDRLPTQVRFKILGLGGKTIYLYAWSHANYGKEITRIRLNQELAEGTSAIRSDSAHSINFADPCVPNGKTLTFNSSQDPLYGDKTYLVKGTGSFSKCTQLIRNSLSLNSVTKSYCPYQPTGTETCPFRTVHQPDVPPSMRFVGVSSFYYTADFIRKIEASSSLAKRQKSKRSLRNLLSVEQESSADVDFEFTLPKMDKLSRSYCSMSWDKITQKFGNINNDDLVNGCFSASYVLSLLKDGYGLESSTDMTFSLTKKNEEVGWTLGAMLFAITNQYSLDPTPERRHSLYFGSDPQSILKVLSIFVIVAAVATFVCLRWRKNRNATKRMFPYSLFNDKGKA